MCRLFATFSQDAIDAAYPMITAPVSLLRLSHMDRKRKQSDGWGVGWIHGGRPKIIKSPNPIYQEPGKARKAARRASGEAVLGHVRWASNPLKLKKGELIGMAHTQPFDHGEWLFVHNGTLYIPREVRAQLGPWARYIRGKNDSEILFYWLLKTVIHGRGTWFTRVRASLKGLDRIWQRCRKSYPIYRYPYHGLNWVLTNGRLLLAFCYVDPRGPTKYPALAHRKQPYYELQIKTTDGGLTIASEPLEARDGWRPVGHGHMIVSEKRGGNILLKNVKVV